MPHPSRRALRDSYPRVVPPPAASGFSKSPALSGKDLSHLLPDVLFYIDAPLLTVAELPDAATLTYTLIECSDISLASVNNSTVMGVHTGAGGIGAVAQAFATRGKIAGGQYFGLRIDASAGVSVASEVFVLRVALT